MPAALLALVGAHLDDLPAQRTGRSGGRRSAHAQAGTLLAGSDVHGRCVLVHRLRHHRLLGVRAPPYLDAKADPTKLFVPYPAWYFLSLFGLLGLVPPEIHVGPLTISLELIATIIVPTLFLLVVLLLPWLDRSRSAQLRCASRLVMGDDHRNHRHRRANDFRTSNDDDQTGRRAAFAAGVGGARVRLKRRPSRAGSSGSTAANPAGAKVFSDELRQLPRRAGPGVARHVPAAGRQSGRHRRCE